MSFRKEKKFRLSPSDAASYKNIMKDIGMKLLFPSRLINSCYFDTRNFQLFSESEEGVLPRKKIRVRWYDQIPNFTKETKISSMEGRFKYSSLMNNLKSTLDLKTIKFFDRSYGSLFPTIIVSYLREYYILNNMRITFDKKINYKSLLINNKRIYDPEIVMEVKVPMSCGDDFIEKFIKVPTSRFSKYARGMLSIF